MKIELIKGMPFQRMNKKLRKAAPNIKDVLMNAQGKFKRFNNFLNFIALMHVVFMIL